MTRAAFLRAYALALTLPEVRPFPPVWPEYYPLGPLIRLSVPPPPGCPLPSRLEPLGLVWYARTGDYRSPLDWRVLAGRLGLGEGGWYRSAADGVDLHLPIVQRWREGLIEGLVSHPQFQDVPRR